MALCRVHRGTPCLKSLLDTYLLGGRLAVFRVVLFAQEEAGHLHLGSIAMGDIAVTARFAGSGLNLGAGFAWAGRGKPESLTRLPREGSSHRSLPPCIPPHPTHQEFGPGSCRRCGIDWRPAWVRGPAPRLP